MRVAVLVVGVLMVVGGLYCYYRRWLYAAVLLGIFGLLVMLGGLPLF